MKSVAILGRQPAISLAELESLFSAKNITCHNQEAALIDVPVDEIPFERLGGTIKLGSVIGFIERNDLKTGLIKLLPKIQLPSKKINLGISAYGLNIDARATTNLSLTLKTYLRHKGHKIRVVPNKELSLNAAQVWHNQLFFPAGLELMLIDWQGQVLVAYTNKIQDIEDYTVRDRERPKRDAHIGMLPPKLAQIIINLAIGDEPTQNATLLDPFCGTGVILQEAALMGFDVIGGDINPKMVSYSKDNLLWLAKRYQLNFKSSVAIGDATQIAWPSSIKTVATETYLGPVFDTLPDRAKLMNITNELNLLHKKFLQNLHKQLAPGSRLCLAIPAWFVGTQVYHLPLLDQLADLGYNRVAFEHAKAEQLIYHRPQQIVARELITLIRN
jgi:SAM-dependent methyltransferase